MRTKFKTRRESNAAVEAICDILQKIHNAGVATDSDTEVLARRLAYIENRHFFLNHDTWLWAQRHHKRVYTWRFANWMANEAAYEEPGKILGWDF